jgi:acyl-CoA dehydrogenase
MNSSCPLSFAPNEDFMTDIDQFRSDVRTWLQDNCPQEMRKPVRKDTDLCWGGRNFEPSCPEQAEWLHNMSERGLTVPDWPKEYGGGGLTPEQSKVLRQEMEKLECRTPLKSFGISMLGPALLKYGNEKQKLEHLPKIARGEIRWCQGYSEPNSGSDLASLTTRAEDKGDHFLVNGQKIWTSHANKSDWIFCLVRTNTSEKHRGISFLLFDMTTPGISTKPIQLISGSSPFCETFFDDVKVPKENVVGEINRGWDVAKYLLAHEREMISATGTQPSLPPLCSVAMQKLGTTSAGCLNDPVLRARIALFEIRNHAFSAMSERFLDMFRAGKAHPSQTSMMKYYGTELNKERYELLMEASGYDGLIWSEEAPTARDWLRTKANSIEGGTSEILLNIISKRILELPES